MHLKKIIPVQEPLLGYVMKKMTVIDHFQVCRLKCLLMLHFLKSSKRLLVKTEEETDKNTEEILEIYNTVGIPTELVTLTDNVSDHAFEGMLNEYDLQPVFVGNEKKNKKSKEVYVYANILKIMENTPTVAYPSLDEFDKEVFHAVLSLYTGGMIAISYEQIARFLSQKKNKRTE